MENVECDQINNRIKGNNCLDIDPENIQSVIRSINHAIHDGNLDGAFRLMTSVLEIGRTSLRQALEANPLQYDSINKRGVALLDVAAALVTRLKSRDCYESETNLLFRFAKAAEIQRLAFEFAKTVLDCSNYRTIQLEWRQSSLLRELAKELVPMEKAHQENHARMQRVDYYVSASQTQIIYHLAHQVGAALELVQNESHVLGVPLQGEFSEDALLISESGNVNTFVKPNGTHTTDEYDKVCKLKGTWTLNLPYDSSRSPNEYVEMWKKYVKVEKHHSLCRAIVDHLLVKLKANLVSAFIDKAFEESESQPILLHFTMPLPASQFDSAYCYLTFSLELQLFDKG